MQLHNPIKKMNLHYVNCPYGDLHSGQIMNLICVDSSCTRRGIICPVCRMKNHQNHEILPLKIFLEQIKKLFLESEDSSSLNNLSDYLRSIENTKKQMISILKEAAENIAEEFKGIEVKINENYLNIRRNVLTQSSISTKLPNLVNLLTGAEEKDPITLQEEFHKYSELLKFQNSKMTVSDKAKKLVQEYSQKPNSVKFSLNEQVKSIHEKFQEIFFSKPTAVKESAPKYTFSTQHKSFQIKLDDSHKVIETNDQIQNLGFAYINEGMGQLNRKITFEITKISSEAIILGLGYPQKDKQFAYIFSQLVADRHYISQCSGYNTPDSQMEDESFVSQPDAFTFRQVGEQVTINFEGEKNKITFTKKTGAEKRVIDLTIGEQEKKKLQFFVVLGQSDSVKIVDT